MSMPRLLPSLFLSLGLAGVAPLTAQVASVATPAKPADTAAVVPFKEDSSVTDHVLRIGAQSIPYRATIGSLTIKNAKGEPTGLLYYTAYVRTDSRDPGQRPIAFIYNGGPGSASVWLHMGAFGPRRVATKDAEYTPPPPYQLVDNANSLLDRTDMVFIDPIGTGFSHVVGKGEGKDFWGVDQDVSSIGQFINRYVTRSGRWNSPKFLIGESYGTFRSAALGNYLQSHDNMTINGIVLISSVLDLSTLTFPAGQDLGYILYLPSYAATAWYHKLVPDAPADLPAFLDEARAYATGPYSTALMQGSALPAQEKAAVAAKLARFTGLSVEYLLKADLRVSEGQFTAELQRSRGFITGRLDARFSGPTGDLLSEFAGSDPQSDAISGAYIAAFNTYVRDELKFSQPDRPYLGSSGEAGNAWEWRHGDPTTAANVVGDLTQAILSNPNLHIEIENGYFDLATPFFATEYTMRHLGLSPKLAANITFKYYDAGHMMYVHDPDLGKLKASISAFIEKSITAQ
jgi:carboxypeptidase C (cathepsin A)